MRINGILHGGSGPVIYIRAAKKLIYNPYAQLDGSIKLAAHSVSGIFSEIDSALDMGKGIVGTVNAKDLTPVIHRVVASARLNGFVQGAKYSKAKLPGNYGKVIREAAELRAGKVSKQMKRTSKRVLKETPDSPYVLSKERALAAMQYEAAVSYFEGVKDAFQGGGWGKAWITAAGESCDDCMDNEGQGAIHVDEEFSSGHHSPPAHNNCMCVLGMEEM